MKNKQIPVFDLDEGASKRPNQTCEEVIIDILRSKENLKGDLYTLWSQYKSFLRYNYDTTMEIYKNYKRKYFALYRKLSLRRFSTTKNCRLDQIIKAEELKSEEIQADDLRENYLEYEQKENSRGLVTRKFEYKKSYMPIIFEQVIPKGSLDKLNSDSDDESTEETKTPTRKRKSSIRKSAKKAKKETEDQKVHYFFLMHGYAASQDDMEDLGT